MTALGNQNEVPPSIRDLYPELTDEELEEAKTNLKRYVTLALRIFERVRDDQEQQSSRDRSPLTEPSGDGTREKYPKTT